MTEKQNTTHLLTNDQQHTPDQTRVIIVYSN